MGDGSGVKREALLKAEADDVMRTETFDVLQVSGVSVCVWLYVVVFYVCFVCGCMCACVCVSGVDCVCLCVIECGQQQRIPTHTSRTDLSLFFVLLVSALFSVLTSVCTPPPLTPLLHPSYTPLTPSPLSQDVGSATPWPEPFDSVGALKVRPTVYKLFIKQPFYNLKSSKYQSIAFKCVACVFWF